LITTTTANRRRLFAEDDAAESLVEMIREVIYETNAIIYAWVIMPDHVHMVLTPPRRLSAGKVVGRIEGRFARRWNLRCGASGPIWQGRSHERVVRSERALEAAVDYVHMNPVKGGIAERICDYRWSSAYASPVAVGRRRGEVEGPVGLTRPPGSRT
jgi:putative transposase